MHDPSHELMSVKACEQTDVSVCNYFDSQSVSSTTVSQSNHHNAVKQASIYAYRIQRERERENCSLHKQEVKTCQ